MLYVGKARDLRARLRSYFAGDRQRPAVEAALGALARVEWRELGSELEASLEELRLIRELRPPANARGARPQSYLRRRGERWTVVSEPTRFGPVSSKRRAQLAARALGDFDGDDLEAALPALRARLPRLARALRFEDAARLRDRIGALEEVADASRGARPAALRGGLHPRACQRAGLLAGVPRRPRAGHGAHDPARCGRQARDRGRPRGVGRRASVSPEDAADLLVVAGYLRRPPPELRVVGLRVAEIAAA